MLREITSDNVQAYQVEIRPKSVPFWTLFWRIVGTIIYGGIALFGLAIMIGIPIMLIIDDGLPNTFPRLPNLFSFFFSIIITFAIIYSSSQTLNRAYCFWYYFLFGREIVTLTKTELVVERRWLLRHQFQRFELADVHHIRYRARKDIWFIPKGRRFEFSTVFKGNLEIKSLSADAIVFGHSLDVFEATQLTEAIKQHIVSLNKRFSQEPQQIRTWLDSR